MELLRRMSRAKRLRSLSLGTWSHFAIFVYSGIRNNFDGNPNHFALHLSTLTLNKYPHFFDVYNYMYKYHLVSEIFLKSSSQ